MDRELWLQHEWRSMRRRLVACIDQQCSELGARSLHLDTSIYTDPQRHQLERERLFLRTPLLAGLSAELPQAGSSLQFDGCGPPVIIRRQEDGSLAAFRNVCPHRGAPLTPVDEGFVCPFHGWRFDRKGELAHRALSQAFPQGETPRLAAVAVAERHGLIFLQQECPAGTIDLADFLGPIDPLLRSFGLGEAQAVGLDEETVAANWKLVVDVSCEGYHVPSTHPRSLAPQLVPFVTIHDHFGRHHRFASPARDLAALARQPEADWPASAYSAVHYLFPNTILTVSSAIDGQLPVIAINRSFPGREIGETRVLYSSYRPAGAAGSLEQYRALHEAVVAINRNEDLPTVAAAWRNYARLPTPAALVFGRNEMLLQHYHRSVAEACGLPLPARG